MRPDTATVEQLISMVMLSISDNACRELGHEHSTKKVATQIDNHSAFNELTGLSKEIGWNFFRQCRCRRCIFWRAVKKLVVLLVYLHISMVAY
jgi:hypothetical protein